MPQEWLKDCLKKHQDKSLIRENLLYNNLKWDGGKMSFSVNTNYGASIAIQQLNETSKALNITQQRINTGLKVSGARDNGAVFAIAQDARADLSGYGVVKQVLDRSVATLDVAVAAGEAISELLIDMKEKALSATDNSLTADQRAAYNEDFKALRDQLATIVNNADFNGVNLINGSTAAISPIANPDGSSAITVSGQTMSLGGTIVTVLATQEVNDAGAAAIALNAVDASINNVSKSLATLGTGIKALEIHNEFVTKIADTLEAGIGNLVDADLARESAKLQALQTKQQLGIQALSIANTASTAILSLFR